MDIGHFFIFYSFSCEGLESYLHGHVSLKKKKKKKRDTGREIGGHW